MDGVKNIGAEFYAEYKDEVLENMFLELKKMRRGTKTATELLFFQLYPEVARNTTDYGFLFEVHRDLLEHAREHNIWIDMTENRFMCLGLPYSIDFAVRDISDITFERQIKAMGLSNSDAWERDVRQMLENALTPILEGSEYYFAENHTDSSAEILELHKEGIPYRLMGFACKKNMEIKAFFNKEFYDMVRSIMELPDNKYPNKTQPHIEISLKTLWNVLCTATGQGVFAK